MAMPWFAWIAVVAIVVWGVLMLIGTITGRPLPGSADHEDVEELRTRIKELEARASAGQLESGEIPTRREENLTAEDRWRLDMLEARIEHLESRDDDTGAARP